MAVQCNPFPHLTYKPCSTRPLSPPFSSTHLFSNQKNSLCFRSNTFAQSTNRLCRVVSAAVVSEEKVAATSSSGVDVFKLTYLEGNSWLWEVGGVRILVDPILVGNLDFGIPWLYDAAKKFLKNFQILLIEP